MHIMKVFRASLFDIKPIYMLTFAGACPLASNFYYYEIFDLLRQAVLPAIWTIVAYS
ncbi:hypothetical protein GCM10017044_03900 [Kordiimonas sediminis]|uniref:Uncharacterized protein n=1 Tax=Kordiimonas sediminis TaxID=1735581 RepID=A0A919ALY6_9PROT|nr:hypothetical protein GCM10017044_03900 [Kordiimonas sediminis]